MKIKKEKLLTIGNVYYTDIFIIFKIMRPLEWYLKLINLITFS